MKKQIKALKNGPLASSWQKIKQDKKNSLMIIGFDILLFISLILFVKIIKVIVPLQSYTLQNLLRGTFGPAIVILYLIVFMGAIIFTYSFFKYLILHKIKNYLVKTKLDYKKLGSFFGLNVIIVLAFIIITLVISKILQVSLKPELVKGILKLIYITLLAMTYSYLNVAHSLFFNQSFREIIKKANKGITSLRMYKPLLNVVIFLVIANLFNNVTVTMRLYQTLSIIIAFLVLYAIIYINRVYFYNLVNEKAKKQ